MPESFRRLRVTRDIPAPTAPHLRTGDVPLAFDGPTVGLDPACVAVVIEVGGAWFGVPKNAVKEIDDAR